MALTLRVVLAASALAFTIGGAEAETLRMLTWGGYAPEELIKKFEAENPDIDVEVTLSNNEEMIAKLRHELEDFVETPPDFMAQLPPEVSQNVGENLSRESFRKNREAVAEQYGVVFLKTDGQDEAYDFTHSDYIYLLDRQGRVRKLYPADFDIDESNILVMGNSGGGVINSGPAAVQLLREFAGMTGIPVTSTLMGLGAFPASDDQWLDLLAAVAFFLLTGRRVFTQNTPASVVAAHLRQAPERPSLHAPGPVPTVLDDLVLQLLEKEHL